MKIILVEDDHMQSTPLIRIIKQRIPDAKILLFETELAFKNFLSSNTDRKPNVFIIDIMLRWTDPSPDMVKMPPEVTSGGIYLAGFRCQEAIYNIVELKNVPIILITMLDKEDLKNEIRNLPKNVTFFSKDGENHELVEKLLELNL